MGWSCGIYGGEERCVRCLLGNPDGKSPLGRPKLKWKDIKIYLIEIVLGGRGLGFIWLSRGKGGGHL